jgi:hypothetical protein
MAQHMSGAFAFALFRGALRCGVADLLGQRLAIEGLADCATAVLAIRAPVRAPAKWVSNGRPLEMGRI